MLFLNTICRKNIVFSRHNFLLNSFKMSARASSSSKKSKLNKVEDKNEEFKAIYKFPYINFLSSFNKLKVYQTALTVISVPFCIMLEKTQMIPESTTIVFTAIGITGLATLCIFSLFTQNVVGILYFNEKDDSVRISYLDFVGRRRNVVYSRKDIIPFSELPKNNSSYYSKVKIYDAEKVNYKLVYKYGGVMDFEAFSRIFGEE